MAVAAMTLLATLLGSGSSDPYKALSSVSRKLSTAANAEIEASLGNVLQQPVFQWSKSPACAGQVPPADATPDVADFPWLRFEF